MRVSRRRHLRERAGEKIVAGGTCGLGPVHGPGRGLAAAEVRAVDQIIVDERRHVYELDRCTGGDRRLLIRGRREEHEQRPEPLPSRCERFVADGGNQPGMGGDGPREPLLERVEVLVEAGSLTDRGERGHSAGTCPTCNATIPPPSRRNETASKPAAPSRRANSCGPGKRRTLAGRYV